VVVQDQDMHSVGVHSIVGHSLDVHEVDVLGLNLHKKQLPQNNENSERQYRYVAKTNV
jgi:hypothetical protein